MKRTITATAAALLLTACTPTEVADWYTAHGYTITETEGDQ